MGYPQANQQTQFLGYPQNQLYNPADLQYMQNTQREFADWGPWQPGMTNVSQWDQTAGAADVAGGRQQMLRDYYQRVGNPYEQSQRQAYWEQMGGQTYGGVIPPRDDPLASIQNRAYNRQANTPWGDLNNMGISAAYGMPAWQQDVFNSQNATPGGGQDPMEQFSLYSTPGAQNPAQDFQNALMTQNPNFPGVPPQNSNQIPGAGPMQPATPEWMAPQQNSWGNNSSNPWGHNGGWGGRGWGR